MRNVLQSKFLWASALVLSLSIAGCNIFNPTESINIKDDDAQALTYEGYKKIRDNEYSNAEYYFNKAIVADSSYSQAWFGLMKAILNRKLNTTQETNVFSLLSYVNASRDSKVPFSGMSDAIAVQLQDAIDSVNAIANQFIERDKAGKTDSVITYKTISEGYMILQMMKTMLVLRKTTQSMEGCSLQKGQQNSCDMASVLNNIKNDPAETVESFNAVFKTCEESPESMTKMFDSYLQGFDNLKEEAQHSAVSSMCGALAQETDKAKDNEDQQTKTLNIIIGQFGYSDIIDDDGDGCVDEELYDGEDNDGDGEIDEDVSDKTNKIEYDNDMILKNVTAGKTAIRDLRVISRVNPNEKYETVDIDMNGKTVADNRDELETEWAFVYPKYQDRVSNNNHRLVFATGLTFNPQGLPPEEYNAYKHAIAKDKDINNIQYDLAFRKQYIGGCWANYDERRFMQWFEGRK
jgi:hypothetical protein